MSTTTTTRPVLMTVTEEQLAMLTHFKRLGRMSASPDVNQEPLIALGLLEVFHADVAGKWSVPRVRLSDAGKAFMATRPKT